ncbi:MAG: iron chaperone [Sphingorhabdus sp.]
MAAAPTSIDIYLERLPNDSRAIIQNIRQRIMVAAPDAVEAIKYGMPTATIHGQNILYYAAWKTHIGLYPIYRGSADFEVVIARYRDKKDSVRFPLNAPIPFDVIDVILNQRIGYLRAATL